MGGFLASDWIRRGSDLANRSFGAVVAPEECKGLGNAGFDFRSPRLDCGAQRDQSAQSCLTWNTSTPQSHWTGYKVWGKASVKQIILMWEKVRVPRVSSSSWGTVGIKEFCILGCWEAWEDVVISGFCYSRAQHFHSWGVVWDGFNRALLGLWELKFAVAKSWRRPELRRCGVCSKAQELI